VRLELGTITAATSAVTAARHKVHERSQDRRRLYDEAMALRARAEALEGGLRKAEAAEGKKKGKGKKDAAPKGKDAEKKSKTKDKGEDKDKGVKGVKSGDDAFEDTSVGSKGSTPASKVSDAASSKVGSAPGAEEEVDQSTVATSDTVLGRAQVSRSPTKTKPHPTMPPRTPLRL
jgi:hypothetical protein